MISKYDAIRYLEYEESKNDPNDFLILSSDKESIIDKRNNNIVCTVDEFVNECRKKGHCDFEVVYSEHVSLYTVLRCRECGTILFTYEDERYDPALACPTCGNYKTDFTYWTAEDIQNDVDKQNELAFIKKMEEHRIASEKRRTKRGLFDWEIWKHTFTFKKSDIQFSLECNDLFATGLKGLNLEISKYTQQNDSIGYILTWHKRIPLSFYAIYIQWIFPHTKRYKNLTNFINNHKH